MGSLRPNTAGQMVAVLERLSRYLCDLAALMVPSYERYPVRVPNLQDTRSSRPAKHCPDFCSLEFFPSVAYPELSHGFLSVAAQSMQLHYKCARESTMHLQLLTYASLCISRHQ